MNNMKLAQYPKYKESGERWIGAVPEGWKIEKLKYLTSERKEKANDLNFSKTYIGLENIESWTGRLIGSTSLEEIDGESLKFRKKDVLFGKLRPYLAKVIVAETDGYCTSELIIYKCKEEVDPYFLKYRFLSKSYIDFVNSLTYGVKMPRADPDQLRNLKLPMPEKAGQIGIRMYLDTHNSKIDELIKKYTQLVLLLKEKRAFLIDQAVTEGLDPETKWKDSGIEWIGKIPEKWSLRKLKTVLKDEKGSIKTGPFGSQLTIDEMNESEVKIYNQRNVISKDETLGENFVSLIKYHELLAFKAGPGDLLITTRGTIGKCLKLTSKADKGILHPCVMKIKVNDKVVVDDYVAFLIEESELAKVQFILQSNATTIDVIYQDNLKQVILPIPPIEDQEKILNYLKSKISKIEKTIKKIKEAIMLLEEYKRSLINNAVTGKIDLREKEWT